MVAQLKGWSGVNLHFLESEANSFNFWCEKAFTFGENRTFSFYYYYYYTINKQAQLR